MSFANTLSLLSTKLYWLLYSDWFTSYLLRTLIPYHSHLLLLLNYVVLRALLPLVTVSLNNCTTKFNQIHTFSLSTVFIYLPGLKYDVLDVCVNHGDILQHLTTLYGAMKHLQP